MAEQNPIAMAPKDAPSQPMKCHPAWLSFMRFCTDLKFGEIERLSIQNGLPVLAETTKKKVKFIAD